MRNKNEDENIHRPSKYPKSVKETWSGCGKERKLWRSSSLTKIFNYSRSKNNSWVLSSRNLKDNNEMKINNVNVSAGAVKADLQPNKLECKDSGVNCNEIVNLILVGATGLPPVPEDGQNHNIYCKFRLGSVSYETKSVPNNIHPQWGERFVLRLHNDKFLNISVWDKGKQENFMGSCILDLSCFERECSHEIWHKLDDGYGQIHQSITVCSSSFTHASLTSNLFRMEDEHVQYTYDLRNSWKVVGSLHVNVIGAKGLDGNIDAYCILELNNEKVQTPKEGGISGPSWNKRYVFNVYDIMSTLNIKVYGRSFSSALRYETVGKVSIPLLTILNAEQRWYALKDRNKKYIAKGNCPRVNLKMRLKWNPVKAAMRIFRPKPVKCEKKSKKYDIALIYSNVDFIGKLLDFLLDINEGYKRLFEWDDPELSFIALSSWLVFCFYFKLWMIPILLLIPFTYYCFRTQYVEQNSKFLRYNLNTSIGTERNDSKIERSLTEKAQDLKHTTVVILNGIKYISSLAERLYNLISFKVPFLSYLTMIIIAISALVFYLVPYNYLLMALGIYKYARKCLNPDRVLNNDLIDFLSRIPDNRKLKEWKELSVPELAQKHSGKMARSISSEALS